MTSYSDCPTKSVTAATGVEYAYRELGDGSVPLLMLQHFRGNLDYWDPPLVDALATRRRVVLFDNAGVGGSTGTTPGTVAEMARDAITFAEALGIESADVLGFSIGSFVAQEVALIRPSLARKVVLAASAPKGAAGMHGWAPDVIAAVGQRQPDPAGYLRVFFTSSDASRSAGRATMQRIFSRTDPDTPTSWQTRQSQYDAVCEWGEPNHALLERVRAIRQPVFVAAGDSDPMILPHYSYLLAGLIPGARLQLYPDAAHGFLFQHAETFAADVEDFLDEP